MRDARVLLGVLAAATAVVGVWALALPASFYADFPFDRAWVALDGPYNEHLVRDVGALNLALALVLVWAWRSATAARVRLAAAATLVYAVPHFGYHAAHLGPFTLGDAIAQMATLAVTVLAPAWLWVSSREAA